MNQLTNEVLQCNILIVDDNPVNAKLLDKVLKVSGFTNITSITDSRVAVQTFLKKTFHTLLLDIRMPHVDGFDIIEQLKQKLPGQFLPIIVITAQTDPETKQKALNMGAVDFVTKPFDFAEVTTRTNNVCQMSLLYHQQLQTNDLLKQKVDDKTAQLRQSRLEILQRLGRAAEYRDNETGAHILRMSYSCQLLAQALNQDPAWCELLLNATPTHDVGKIGIPDQILLKPGKLEPDEWATMQKHAEMGAAILSESDDPLLQMAAEIALCHHEKFDGSGYPRGLKGEEIPLHSRIASICDVFDALLSRRPYKDPWKLEDAVDFIKQNSGSHFDPEITEVFLAIIPDILKLREKFKDPED